MPRRIDTRMIYTVEQKVFALGAWLDTESMVQACQMFENYFRFKISRATMASLIYQHRLKNAINPPAA